MIMTMILITINKHCDNNNDNNNNDGANIDV